MAVDDDPLVMGFLISDPVIVSQIGPARLRAPRRPDTVKKQVAVPRDMWSRLEEAAGPLGTTPNDLFVRLASSALGRVEQLGRTRLIAADRWAKFEAADSVTTDGAFVSPELSADELVRAAQAFGEDE